MLFLIYKIILNILGTITVITLIFWIIFSSNYPNNNRWISIKEENYIYAKTSSQFQSPLIENSDKIKLPDLSQIRFKKKEVFILHINKKKIYLFIFFNF